MCKHWVNLMCSSCHSCACWVRQFQDFIWADAVLYCVCKLLLLLQGEGKGGKAGKAGDSKKGGKAAKAGGSKAASTTPADVGTYALYHEFR